jgi:hypothetical protein
VGLSDEKGHPRVSLGVDKYGPYVILDDEQGIGRVTLVVDKVLRPPVVLPLMAPKPVAVFSLPLVFKTRAPAPVAVFDEPVVLALSAANPNAHRRLPLATFWTYGC